MDMERATILEGGIDDTLWPEIVLAMTHIKNLRPTRAFTDSMSPFEMQDQALPTLQHLRILGSNVYAFLHEEEQRLKSAKWKARALKGKLVCFDGHTIYRVHIEYQNKIIRVKDTTHRRLTSKATTSLSDFHGKPTFDGVQIPDEQTPSDQSSDSEEEKTSQKQTPKRPAKSQAGRIIKPTPKSQTNSRDKALLTQLVTLLDNDWGETGKVTALLDRCYNDDSGSKVEPETDPLHILATAIHKANAGDASEFTSSTQLDVEEPETYERAIYGPHGQQ